MIVGRQLTRLSAALAVLATSALIGFDRGAPDGGHTLLEASRALGLCEPSEQLCGLSSAVAGLPAGSTLILPSVRIVLENPEPIEISHDVTIAGRGAPATVLDGSDSGPIFRIHDGATLTLRDLSVLRGTDNPSVPEEPGSVRLERVHLGGGILAPGPELDGRPLYCFSGSTDASQYYRSALLSDPTALSRVPGSPFT